MVFEVLSSTELAAGPAGRVVRVGGRCMAGAPGELPAPALLVGGLRIAPRERGPLRIGPIWAPFALTYAIPPDTPRDGWMLEVAPASDAALEAAMRALEAVEAIHARIDQLERQVASPAGSSSASSPSSPVATG